MDVVVGDNLVKSLYVRLSVTKIDFWVPLQLSEWKGEECKIVIFDINDDALCIKSVYLSDSFDFEYNEQYRAGYHFTPFVGWMNDPNGLVYYDGEYHLHNPYGTLSRNLCWGHAVGADLIHWEYLIPPICPDSLGDIWSGSAIVDNSNTSGFQAGNEKSILAFYTNAGSHQVQSLAFSNDRGRTFSKYERNPIIPNSDLPDFRDPKVMWYEPTQRWIMILAVGGVVRLYSSPDCKEWVFESVFGEGYGSHDGVWECPDIFEIPVEGQDEQKYVITVNTGYRPQYFVGTFDGKNFHCEFSPEEVHWLEYGRDSYAMVSWSNAPGGRRVSLAWMCMFDYCNDLPTRNYRGTMSFPREIKLIRKNNSEYTLTNNPVVELHSIRGDNMVYANITVLEGNTFDEAWIPTGGMYEVEVDVGNITSQFIGIRLFNEIGEYVLCYINLVNHYVYIDRVHGGNYTFSDRFGVTMSAPVDEKSKYHLHLLVDKNTLELFEGEGVSLTSLIFPSQPYNHIEFYCEGGSYTIESLTIYKLNP